LKLNIHETIYGSTPTLRPSKRPKENGATPLKGPKIPKIDTTETHRALSSGRSATLQRSRLGMANKKTGHPLIKVTGSKNDTMITGNIKVPQSTIDIDSKLCSDVSWLIC